MILAYLYRAAAPDVVEKYQIRCFLNLCAEYQVEQTVNSRMNQAMSHTRSILLEQFSQIRVAELAEDFDHCYAEYLNGEKEKA